MPKENETENEVLDTKEPKEEVKEEEKLSTEELKTKAEELEAELRIARKEREELELSTNYTRRIEKAEEKLASYREVPQPNTPPQQDTDVRDLLALAKSDIAEDSEEAQILKRYKDGGIIKNYGEGINHAGIKAEFALLKEKNTAKTVVDENDTDEYLKTTKEIIASYRASGTVPEDPKLRKAIADENLKEMGV